MSGPIKACQRCGHTRFRTPGLSDGIVPETDNLAEWTCAHCDLRAVPLEFEHKADHEAFLATIPEDVRAPVT